MLRISMGLNGAKYLSLLRFVIGVFMFGIQTFFISKSITYLIRIFIYYNLDSQILDDQVFLAFFLGLNIIDWISLVLTFATLSSQMPKSIGYYTYLLAFVLYLFDFLIKHQRNLQSI